MFNKLRCKYLASLGILLVTLVILALLVSGCARSNGPSKPKTHDTGCLVERTEVIKQELHGLDHHIWEENEIIKSLEGQNLHVKDSNNRYLTILSATDRKRYIYTLAEHLRMTNKGRVILFDDLRVGLPVEVKLDGTTITELSVVRP
jgi:hypothetical protein